jgi:N-acetylglucosaminyldiphosphoundecaprenol N-acetyl-beta-D-mannosaminyltransferase
VIAYAIILHALAAAALGCTAGYGLGYLVFLDENRKPRDFHGHYFGGLPILGAISGLLLTPGFSGQKEILALTATLAGFVILGMVRDFRKTAFRVLLPYQILLVIFGAFFGIEIVYRTRGLGVILTVCWPVVIMYCLKLASLIFEMPFLLCLGSGITFLLFFADQAATPPVSVILTLGMIVVSASGLFFLLKSRKGFLGDSGLFALGYLLAAISMLGRSKTLLMFGLLVPSMVIFYPFVLISLLIMSSYLGNELYLVDPKERKASYKWYLTRGHLVFFSAVVFFCLNLFALFVRVRMPLSGYLALGIIFLGAIATFIRTFARKSAENPPAMGTRIQILGVPMDVVDSGAAIEQVNAFLQRREGLFHIVTADSLAVFRAFRDKAFGRIVQRASLVVPDGAGLIWSADFLGTPLPARVPGIGLVEDICRAAEQKGWSVFFLGARPGIAEEAVKVLSGRFPGLKVAGMHHGYFYEGSQTEDQVLADIVTAKPDVLLAALGVPKQENFIQRLRLLANGMVAVGVGGSFDVISGNIPRAPQLMQRFALEWLFRLWKEPRRLSRIMRIPWFVLAVIRAKWQEKEFVV